jgi:hypothetical protein
MGRGVLLVLLAAAAFLAPLPYGLVERLYSTSVYAVLQAALTGLSNRVSFAVFDLLLVVVLGAWLVLAGGDVARGTRGPHKGMFRAAARIAARTLVWAATLYLLFLVTWGLNYRRQPLIDKVVFDATAVNADAVRSLALTAVDRLNALYDEAHRTGWPAAGAVDTALAETLARADRQLGGRGVVTVGRPKTTLLDWYFRRASVDGMTDPYFLETLVSSSLLPFERPFVLAHEWSHLAGFAEEGDANFVAWLACVQGTPSSQYSGWLFLYSELAAALGAQARAEMAGRLAPGPRADLVAIRDRVLRQVDPRLLAAGQRVYDGFLKANRVESGIKSYDRVVQLVVGVRFRPGWVPVVR